jgi:hypothetical protein
MEIAAAVYGHALNRGPRRGRSPLDRLRKPVSGEKRKIIRKDRSA